MSDNVPNLAIRASWQHVEPARGRYHCDAIDAVPAALRPNGLASLTIHAGQNTPAWLLDRIPAVPVDGVGYPPPWNRLFQNFLIGLVNFAGGTIMASTGWPQSAKLKVKSCSQYAPGAARAVGSFQRVVPAGTNAMPIVKRSASQIGKGRVNRLRLRASTERVIARQIASDPDTPEMSAADLRRLRRVYNPPVPDLRAIRHELGLSQAESAQRFGFSVGTIQQWEQTRAVPLGYCRA